MSEIDPFNLEGPGPTEEEFAENRRNLAKLTKQERFELMFRGVETEDTSENLIEVHHKVHSNINFPEKVSFALALMALRKDAGLTQAQAAKVARKTTRTVIYWEKGVKTPKKSDQNLILAAIRRSIAPPCESKRRRIAENHHLHWEKSKGWILRLTLCVNKKIVGKRVKTNLRTHNLKEALKRRAIVVAAYEKIGFDIPQVILAKRKTKTIKKEN